MECTLFQPNSDPRINNIFASYWISVLSVRELTDDFTYALSVVNEKIFRTRGVDIIDYHATYWEICVSFRVASNMISRQQDLNANMLDVAISLEDEISSFVDNFFHQIKFPTFWDMTMKCSVAGCIANFMNVHDSSKEYMKIYSLFEKDYPTVIIKSIQRVQNRIMWYHYAMKRNQISVLNNGFAGEKFLIHGTSSVPPSFICNSYIGFDINCSNGGMWGKGIYFTDQISYAHTYRYENISSIDSNKKIFQLIFAIVTLGNIDHRYDQSNKNHKFDITLSNKNQAKTKVAMLQPGIPYHSICGHINDQLRAYVVCENCRAYPAYIVSYCF